MTNGVAQKAPNLIFSAAEVYENLPDDFHLLSANAILFLLPGGFENLRRPVSTVRILGPKEPLLDGGARSPHQKKHFRRTSIITSIRWTAWACRDLSAVDILDILNVIRKRAAAMPPLATSTQSINLLGNKGLRTTYKSQYTIYNNYSARQL